MTPRIETLKETKLIGTKLSISIMQNKTGLLWSQFAPRIKEIEGRVSEDRFSLQIYPAGYFEGFDPNMEFVKWAAVEVESLGSIPAGMDSLILTQGEYAVFDYKGLSSDPSMFQYIYSEWLPNSTYQLDDRPHFEVLGKNYQNDSPDSEEEIWIPIK